MTPREEAERLVFVDEITSELYRRIDAHRDGFHIHLSIATWLDERVAAYGARVRRETIEECAEVVGTFIARDLVQFNEG